MRKPLEIIAGIKDFISNNNPFRFPYLEESILNSLNELENELTPQLVVEEPIVEESIVEESIVEEPIVQTTTKKPRSKK